MCNVKRSRKCLIVSFPNTPSSLLWQWALNDNLSCSSLFLQLSQGKWLQTRQRHTNSSHRSQAQTIHGSSMGRVPFVLGQCSSNAEAWAKCPEELVSSQLCGDICCQLCSSYYILLQWVLAHSYLVCQACSSLLLQLTKASGFKQGRALPHITSQPKAQTMHGSSMGRVPKGILSHGSSNAEAWAKCPEELQAKCFLVCVVRFVLHIINSCNGLSFTYLSYLSDFLFTTLATQPRQVASKKSDPSHISQANQRLKPSMAQAWAECPKGF